LLYLLRARLDRDGRALQYDTQPTNGSTPVHAAERNLMTTADAKLFP
jgi:hypothetical protein